MPRDTGRTSDHMDADIVDAARQSDAPDVSTYSRPATTRITSANLALSIVILVAAMLMALIVYWILF